MAEAGYPSLEDLTWYGFFVPAKTPASIVARLNGAVQMALRSDEVKSGMTKLGVEMDAIAMDEFSRLIASESERWKGIVRTTGFIPRD
jgi:tripartite-type tricarboxylate transporter receptor subunit TctC